MVVIWFLSSNNFILAANALQEHTPSITTVNQTSIKVIATNSSTAPPKKTVSIKATSALSDSIVTPPKKTVSIKATSAFFNVIARTFAAELPQTLLPSYTITNNSGTFSQRLLSANNTLSSNESYLQQPSSKTIQGTTDPASP